MRNNQERLNPTQFQQPQQPEQPQPQGVFSFAVPTEFVELPSKGKYYPEGHPLHMVKEVEIKHMTAKEEDILTSQSLIQRGVALDRLIQSVLIDKRIDVNSLLSGDRNALLVACRKYGYGLDYEVVITCEKCLAENTKLLNIDEWKAKKVKNNDEFQYTLKDQRFFTTLPSSGIEISFKILNVNELNKIRKTIEENISLEMLESSSSLFLFSILESVAGYTDSTSLNNFVQSVPIKDSLYIRNLYSFVEPDISTKTNFNCLDCGHQEDMEVPLGVDFFWPKR